LALFSVGVVQTILEALPEKYKYNEKRIVGRRK